jgi:hypothetical protein
LELKGIQFLMFGSSVFDDGSILFENLFCFMQIIDA